MEEMTPEALAALILADPGLLREGLGLALKRAAQLDDEGVAAATRIATEWDEVDSPLWMWRFDATRSRYPHASLVEVEVVTRVDGRDTPEGDALAELDAADEEGEAPIETIQEAPIWTAFSCEPGGPPVRTALGPPTTYAEAVKLADDYLRSEDGGEWLLLEPDPTE